MPLAAASGSAGVSGWRHARAVLLLPCMNAVVIPGLLLALTQDFRLVASGLRWLAAGAGLALLAGGLLLVALSIRLFVRLGRGTLAPWDPTRQLITDQVYRFSRNPMKSGLFLVLIGESLLFGSRVLLVWAAVFIAANLIYIRRFEEPGLARRFGAEYTAYRERVPRWLGARRPGRRQQPAGNLS